MARPPHRPLLTTQDDHHLAALRRLVRGLEKDSKKIFARPAKFSSAHHVSTLILALLNLAKRNLRPASLIRRPGEDGANGGATLLLDLLVDLLADRISPKSDFESHSESHITDETDFAAACCGFLAPLDSLDESQCLALVAALKVNINKARYKPQANHPQESLLEATSNSAVSVGWAHEYVNQEKGALQDLENSENSGDNRYLTPTQFFTPSWIAAMLAEQALGNGRAVTSDTFTLLDPACGAGHLLVPAFRLLFSLHDVGGGVDQRRALLQKLLANCIYGLDVDEALIDLARFALYLTARDLEAAKSDFAPLPSPKLIALTKPLGSLVLADRKASRPTEDKLHELPESFDAIVMNPPYLSTRTMDDTTRKFLRDYFATASGDLYTAFIELSMRLLKDGGCISTVVQQSFLSIARYRQLRLSLLHEHHLLSSIVLGTGAFPSRPGEKVNNAIITVQKKPTRLQSAPALSFHRLADDKKLIMQQEEAQNLVAQITGQPFAFHCPPDVSRIFGRYPAMSNPSLEFDLTNGLFTCNNKRFVKNAAEVDALTSSAERNGYVPYDKGGGQRWFHSTPHRLKWGESGESIRAYRLERGQSRSLPGEQFYFQPGVTYSYIGTKGFKARLLSEGSIFDIASSAVFSRKYDLHYLLGFLNSALAAYLLSLLNPTINFQIGDLRKLPFKVPGSDLEGEIAALAAAAVALVKGENSGGREEALALAQIQIRIDELIFDHYAVSKSDRVNICADPWVSRVKLP